MNQQETVLRTLFIILSVISSFVFVFYGVNVISSGDLLRQWVTTFAYVTAGYGLANIMILSLSWSSRAAWAPGASKLISLCYFGVYIMDAINKGLDSGLGVVGLVLVAAVLWCNWQTIQKVVARPE